MTDRWISSKRHFCQTCQIWLSGHARNIDNHEKSEAHQANSQRLIREMHQRERKRKQDTYALNAEILKIEEAAFATLMNKDAPPPKPVSHKAVPQLKPGAIGPAGPPPKQKGSHIERPGQIAAAPAVIDLPPPPPPPPPGRAGPVSSTPFPSTTGCLRSIWMMSVNPTTNQPYYFNTITGETRDTDPSGDVATPGGIYGARGMTGREIHDQQADAAIAELLPNVNDMADLFRQHILASKPAPAATLAAPASSTPEASAPAPAVIKAAGKSIIIPARRQQFHTLTLPLVPAPSSSPPPAPQTAPVPDQPSAPLSPELVTSAVIDEATGVGAWEEVAAEESKFGDIDEDIEDPCEAKSDFAAATAIEVFEEGNSETKTLTTSALLLALREEADADELLNDEDLRRRSKREIIKEEASDVKIEVVPRVGLFKKRVVKPVTSKSR